MLAQSKLFPKELRYVGDFITFIDISLKYWACMQPQSYLSQELVLKNPENCPNSPSKLRDYPDAGKHYFIFMSQENLIAVNYPYIMLKAYFNTK